MNQRVSPDEIATADPAAVELQTDAAAAAKRKTLFAGLAGAVLLAGAGAVAWNVLVASRHVTTDNAYVSADAAQVAAQVGAPVREVRVTETMSVKRGDVLVVLDDVDARLDLAQAQAALSQAERRVRGYFANDGALDAQVGARTADEARVAAQVAAASSDLERARTDLGRRQALAGDGSVSGEELSQAQNGLRQAEAALNAARAAQAQASANRRAALGTAEAASVMTAGTTVQSNPEVAAARARLDQAQVNLERTVIRAPVDGVIARRQVQIGQRVQPGAALMSVVPVQQAYVDANFKEGQLTKVRVGQAVELESDLYGGKVKFHGKVVGLAGGTGSAFAVIPSQNATGNWIKVVQRVPVRVALDPAELKAHPLRVGLSMKAKIDVAGR
jgi:membrane fusion protein (multidrug efflux system)